MISSRARDRSSRTSNQKDYEATSGTTDASFLIYDITIALACTTLVVLIAFLFILCRKKSVEPEDYPPVRLVVTTWPLTATHAATEGFSNRRIVGKGRLGTIYIAVFPDGKIVAIKRIDPRLVLCNISSDFSTKMKALSQAQHPHVVPILGYCEAPGERMIIMELMAMNSLESHLHGDNNHLGVLLDWPRRLRVVAEAARGIEYLHEGAFPHIIHGCVKSSNILMDSNFSARVSDYGLYFLADSGGGGGGGFLDSEYSIAGLCKACDVYGFGVVLLEILSGRRWEGGLLLEWALPLIRESRAVEILDQRLRVPLDPRPLIRLAKVASACVSNTRKNRPSIVHVAAILNNLEI